MSNERQKVSSGWAKNIFYLLAAASISLGSYSYYLRSISQMALADKERPEEHDFRLVQLGEFRRDQFLIDQKTGRTWVATCIGEAKSGDCDGAIMWQERLAVGLNGYTHDDFMNYINHLESMKKAEKKEPQENKQ